MGQGERRIIMKLSIDCVKYRVQWFVRVQCFSVEKWAMHLLLMSMCSAKLSPCKVT
jgi:hypothetical protein